MDFGLEKTDVHRGIVRCSRLPAFGMLAVFKRRHPVHGPCQNRASTRERAIYRRLFITICQHTLIEDALGELGVAVDALVGGHIDVRHSVRRHADDGPVDIEEGLNRSTLPHAEDVREQPDFRDGRIPGARDMT